MALKPISLNLLEDEFVCQCRYVSEDIRYAEYLEEKEAKGRKHNLNPRLTRTQASANVRAKA